MKSDLTTSPVSLNIRRSHAVTCQNETFQTGQPKTKARSSVTAQDRAFLLPISRRKAHDAGGEPRRTRHAGRDIFSHSLTRLMLSGCGAKSSGVQLATFTVMAARPLPQGLGLQDDRCPSVKDSLRWIYSRVTGNFATSSRLQFCSHSNLSLGVTVPVASYFLNPLQFLP